MMPARNLSVSAGNLLELELGHRLPRQQNERLPYRQIAPRSDPAGFPLERRVEGAVEPGGHGLDAASRLRSQERLTDPELGESDRREQRVGVGAANNFQTMALSQRAQPRASEALALVRELGMAAAERVESGHARHQQAARRKNASQLPHGPVLVAAREVDDDIQGQRQIESAGCKRQRRDIGLRQAVHSQTLPVAEALPSQVDWKDAQIVARGEGPGKMAGAAAGFEDALEGAFPGYRIEQAEQDLAHAAIPPEILLGPGNVVELGRIHPLTFILNLWVLQYD